MDRPFAAYTGDDPYFFVSYAHKDAAVVFPELVRLRDLGFNIWYDEGIEPGTEWRDELASAIRGAAGFLFFVTSNSVASENCRNEINFALKLDCALVSIHLTSVDMPDGLVFSLGSRQAILKYELTPEEYVSKLEKLRPTGSSQTERNPIRTSHAGIQGNNARYLLALAFGIVGLVAGIALYLLFASPDESEPKRGATRMSASDLPSIAVLPFTNISNDAANMPFTAGIHDDLLTHLSRISTLRTLSRTSVMQYQGTTKTIPQIGSELDVGAILEGSIQRSGNLVRINTQLIDVASDEHLWAEIFDRELTPTNLFAVQGEIAEAVAEALRVTLLPEEKRRIEQAPTLNMAAYDLYLLGRHEWNQRTAQSIEKSRDFFEEALAMDPDFVPALSGLADSYIQLVKYGNMKGAVAYPMARDLIDRAMKLDDAASEVWASLGSLQSETGNIKEAEIAFERAIALDEKNFSAWMWYGDFLNQSTVRQYRRGLDAYLRAEALEPMSKPLNEQLIAAYHRRGDFVSNLKHQLRLIQIDPANALQYQGYIAGNLLQVGRQAEAIGRARELQVKDPGYHRFYRSLVQAYVQLELFDEARVWAERHDALLPSSPVRSMVLIGEGKYAEVSDALEKMPNSVYFNQVLFQLYFAAGNSEAARNSLAAYLVDLNNELIVRPGNYENIWNLQIADFWIHHGSDQEKARGKALAGTIRENLDTMINEGFRQSKTYFLLAYARGLTGDESGLYAALDTAIDHHWIDIRQTELLRPLTARPADLELRLKRIQLAIDLQVNALSRMDLPEYVPPGPSRKPIVVSKARLTQYEGYYSSGGAIYRVYLNDEGDLAYMLADAISATLKAISLNEFYPASEPNVQFEFFQDNNQEVTHAIRKLNFEETYLKVVPPPPATIDLPVATLKKYVGHYQFNPLPDKDGVVTSDLIRLEVFLSLDNTLWIKERQRYVETQKILPFSHNEFLRPGFLGTYAFVLDPVTDTVDHVIRERDGVRAHFERVAQK